MVMPYLKALTAAVIAGLGTLQVAYADNVITNQEWVTIAVTTLVALGGVWAVPNAARAARAAQASWGTSREPAPPSGPPRAAAPPPPAQGPPS
jgi:hypothetical protein